MFKRKLVYFEANHISLSEQQYSIKKDKNLSKVQISAKHIRHLMLLA
jgi:hypothetical protein